MFKNYLISAIRAIARDPWETLIRVLAISLGTCTSTIHILLMISGQGIIIGHLLFATVILVYSGILFELSFRRASRSNEFTLRLLFGESDPRLRWRKLIEAFLIISFAVILGVVAADYIGRAHLYFQNTSFGVIEYMPAVLLLSAFEIIFFVAIVYAGMYLTPGLKSIKRNIYGKIIAGSLVILTSVVISAWFLLTGSSYYNFRVFFFDPLVFIFLSFASWNIVGNLTLLNTKPEISDIHKGSGTKRILYLWLKEIGPAALSTIIITVLGGSLFLAAVALGLKFLPFLSIFWFVFSASLIFLGVLQSIIKAFLYKSGRSDHEVS